MSTQTLNSIDTKDLYTQYSWYRNNFPPIIQKACDEFFMDGLQMSLVSISKNINPLMDKASYFVTKIQIDKQYDMFFRSSDKAISLILDRALGKTNKTFNLNKITDLEAKVITAFNDYTFNMCKTLLSPAPVGELRRTNFDVIHLTFLLKDIEENTYGKFIVSLPDALLNPETITSTGEKFNETSFQTSTIDVKIKIGTTKFSVFDLKTLDYGDLVVLDNSDTRKMTLIVDDYIKDFEIETNLGLITPTEDNGGNNMGADNLWDSIEVEMVAEFDAVKITLGELKNIETGNVVDLTSLYNNKVTLKVEDKAIAKGELVIINDRYGIKIDEIVAKQEEIPTSNQETVEEEAFEENEYIEEEQQPNENSEEEFDYSDFELEDEDI